MKKLEDKKVHIDNLPPGMLKDVVREIVGSYLHPQLLITIAGQVPTELKVAQITYTTIQKVIVMIITNSDRFPYCQ